MKLWQIGTLGIPFRPAGITHVSNQNNETAVIGLGNHIHQQLLVCILTVVREMDQIGRNQLNSGLHGTKKGQLKKLCKALHNFFYAKRIVMQSDLRNAI